MVTGATRVERMYDVRGKRCQEPGCTRQPGFGDPVSVSLATVVGFSGGGPRGGRTGHPKIRFGRTACQE